MTKKPPNTVFLKVDIPVHVMAELDESLAHYGCWRSRAAFMRDVVDRWLKAWRERDSFSARLDAEDGDAIALGMSHTVGSATTARESD